MDNNLKVGLEQNKSELSVGFESSEKNENSHGGHSHHSHHSHHSSHHSHHHSHHSSRRKNKKRKEKFKRFWKRNKHKIINVVLAVLLVAALAVIGVMFDKQQFSDSEKAQSSETAEDVNITDASIKVEIPLFDEDVVLVSPAITKYMSSDISVSASSIYSDYVALGRLDKGLPVKLWYEVEGIPEGYSVRSAELLVSEKNDFKSSIVYSFDGEETSVDVYNLKTGTQYYYKFVLSLSNGTKSSVEGSFRTADTPRFLNIDGTYNLRDVGGYKTIDGKTVRQGLLYRSTEIDGAVDSKYKITADGVNSMLNVLGIRTDMDLRSQSENSGGTDVLGAGVKHTYYGASMYTEVFTENGKAAIRKIFADLADKNNYPVLMHCTHGMDRTGTVCYLLGAILGVSENDLMRDYQLSAFYHGNLWGLNQMNEFIGGLKSYEGATIGAKAESYLLSAGVTAEEIESIKEIFLS